MKSATWAKNGSRNARAVSGTRVSSMAAVISEIQRSLSASPILNGMWRILSRGCPRDST